MPSIVHVNPGRPILLAPPGGATPNVLQVTNAGGPLAYGDGHTLNPGETVTIEAPGQQFTGSGKVLTEVVPAHRAAA